MSSTGVWAAGGTFGGAAAAWLQVSRSGPVTVLAVVTTIPACSISTCQCWVERPSRTSRTLTSNGDGSDHAWGGIQLVIGDAVKGRSFYGSYPVLTIGGPEDVGGGRFIPAVSADQYAATLSRWFGVDESQIPTIAPSIGNFAETDLGFPMA